MNQNEKDKLPPELYDLGVKDVQRITGKTQNTSWRKLKKLREALKRESYQAVFLTEFCAYFKYPLQESCVRLGIANNQK